MYLISFARQQLVNIVGISNVYVTMEPGHLTYLGNELLILCLSRISFIDF